VKNEQKLSAVPLGLVSMCDRILTNPTFIAEVLSPSTEAYDLGDKFRRYRTLATFREYLTLSQLEILAEFQVPLDEYEIPLPQFLILKVANVHELKVKFRATQKQVDH